MLKIVVCGNKKGIKEIEDILSQCLGKERDSIEIHHVSSPLYILRDYLADIDFKLCIISSRDGITYMINDYTNVDLRISHYIAGKIKFPLTKENINKSIVEKLKSSWTCPYGSYVLRRKGEIRRILHDEIEYIHREKKGAIVYLNNGDSELIAKSIAKVAKQLDKSYFIKCSKGYMVNIFNIEKIDTSSKRIIMKSGAEIPISRKGQGEFLKALFITIRGRSATSEN